MKRLTTILYMVLLIFCSAATHAQKRQSARPLLFAGLPTKINCTANRLDALFTATTGENISLSLSDHLTISGVVTSNLAKYSNLQTIVIKLTQYKNTLFSLSKQTGKDNSHTYTGRIFNPLYADGFELKKAAPGDYQLIKIDMEKILVDCSQQDRR